MIYDFRIASKLYYLHTITCVVSLLQVSCTIIICMRMRCLAAVRLARAPKNAAPDVCVFRKRTKINELLHSGETLRQVSVTSPENANGVLILRYCTGCSTRPELKICSKSDDDIQPDLMTRSFTHTSSGSLVDYYNHVSNFRFVIVRHDTRSSFQIQKIFARNE